MNYKYEELETNENIDQINEEAIVSQKKTMKNKIEKIIDKGKKSKL